MRWADVRSAHPDQWLVIEALEAHTENRRRVFDRIAVIEPGSRVEIRVGLAQHLVGIDQLGATFSDFLEASTDFLGPGLFPILGRDIIPIEAVEERVGNTLPLFRGKGKGGRYELIAGLGHAHRL
jgi:hypothetical protein